MTNEADTCRKFVVPKLQSAGWDNEPHSIAEPPVGITQPRTRSGLCWKGFVGKTASLNCAGERVLPSHVLWLVQRVFGGGQAAVVVEKRVDGGKDRTACGLWQWLRIGRWSNGTWCVELRLCICFGVKGIGHEVHQDLRRLCCNGPFVHARGGDIRPLPFGRCLAIEDRAEGYLG